MSDGADYSCPECGRPTLVDAPEDVVDYQCAVCGELVFEREVAAV